MSGYDKGKAKLIKKDVLHIADLAHLDLTEDEIKKFLPQLASIVDYIGQLDEVNTQGVEPTSQTTGLTNVFRPDEVRASSINQEEALSGTDTRRSVDGRPPVRCGDAVGDRLPSRSPFRIAAPGPSRGTSSRSSPGRTRFLISDF